MKSNFVEKINLTSHCPLFTRTGNDNASFDQRRSISSYYLISQLFNCVYTSEEMNENKSRERKRKKKLFDFIGDKAKYTQWN